MAKFKIGDKVKIKKDKLYEYEDSGIFDYSVGTVLEVDSAPFVSWEFVGKFAVSEHNLELYIDPASEISKIINQSLDRENSWDDSIEIGESMDLPVDRFEFRYVDEYGRDLSHKLNLKEGQYDICDIVAEMRLFLMAVGYDREDVYKYIREDRL